MSVASTREVAYWRRMGEIWEKWEAIHLHNLSSVDPYLFRTLALKPGQRVLDVGCGIGEPALTAGAWVGSGGAVVGIDVSPGMIEVARRQVRSTLQRPPPANARKSAHPKQGVGIATLPGCAALNPLPRRKTSDPRA